MLLKRVRISKYKSFLTEQSIDIEKDVTRIVGKNESGKTAILEALAKFNYFEDDKKYKFSSSSDYPRGELTEFNKTDKNFNVVTCDFEISEELLLTIEKDCGEDLIDKNFTLSVTYNNTRVYSNISFCFEKFINNIINKYEIPEDLKIEIKKIKNFNSLLDYFKTNENEKLKVIEKELNRIVSENKFKDWDNPVEGYIFSKYISPNIPKFWYFDEYFSLPSRIDLTELSVNPNTNKYSDEEKNIIEALFDLANLDIKNIVNETEFEQFIALLEATSNKITDDMFKYWNTNKNLEIKFVIDNKNNQKILDIRIYNKKHRVSLPLKNRSKGFTWFFSFLVWFSRIQGEEKSKYILLLDEPGLNLHASAQNDLLDFVNKELAPKYQVIYTTHSPFMIDSEHLHQVRTVYDSQESGEGSIISDALKEKDPSTLFPLQAALGYDIAQNLYISKNNLLVEGISDIVFITAISEYLKEKNKIGLNENITIVPVGGLDKVVSFISLLRGNKLDIVCLLDNFTDPKGEQRLNDLIKGKIIKDKNILFFGDFAELKNNKAELEDMFDKKKYIDLFNITFSKDNLKIDSKNINIENPIIPQINQIINKPRFNHYRPANEFLKSNEKEKYLDENTILKFENMFKKINELFKTNK